MIGNRADSAQPQLEIPKIARSRTGYEFDPASDKWRISKDIVLNPSISNQVAPETGLGFRLALTRYAAEYAAQTAKNMEQYFLLFLRDTNSREITAGSLTNWRNQLGATAEWKLGALRSFLLSWHAWNFPGVPEDVPTLLRNWRIRGNEKGRAVAQGDPEKGPYTDLEMTAILNWANRALTLHEIELTDYAYLMTLAMTARRPGQIAALRGGDLINEERQGVAPSYTIRFPRAKQRGLGFRQTFHSLPIIEDLYLTLLAQHQASVAKVSNAVGSDVPLDLKSEIPVFINDFKVKQVCDLKALSESLLGPTPDRLHITTKALRERLDACHAACKAKSERTGKRIRLVATRFRYTRGTNLRREGFGAEVIAELLDHSDTQNVKVYTENTVEEAVVINRYVGAKLAPFAQACMGTLVNSEREAIRGDDSRSRVPNQNQDAVGTCGHYGFCASGYRACYTCHHFQPWVDGPHEDVLIDLYEEKKRTADAGCAPEVVNANDQLILAVEHCVAFCNEAKERLLDQPGSQVVALEANDG